MVKNQELHIFLGTKISLLITRRIGTHHIMTVMALSSAKLLCIGGEEEYKEREKKGAEEEVKERICGLGQGSMVEHMSGPELIPPPYCGWDVVRPKYCHIRILDPWAQGTRKMRSSNNGKIKWSNLCSNIYKFMLKVV